LNENKFFLNKKFMFRHVQCLKSRREQLAPHWLVVEGKPITETALSGEKKKGKGLVVDVQYLSGISTPVKRMEWPC